MGIFPVEFPSTTEDGFESFRLLHYLAFIKGRLWGRRKVGGTEIKKARRGCFPLAFGYSLTTGSL
ncbi:hypothetical protein [Bacteroides thetaiotaomicron]|uniref:hypothetical protein n=1 Tax=Bacteroides thetaiotaomicron TaxID=818 RepID=UPI0039C87E53